MNHLSLAPAMAILQPVHQPNLGRLQNLNRKKNWDDTEDENLARCWLKAVEQHPQKETKSAEFWRLVTDFFKASTAREEERTDDACNQRFTNLSKACTLWLMARDSILTMAQFQGKEDDKLTEATQVQYKQLMGTDKVFKHFRVLDLLKNNARWIELSQTIAQRAREQPPQAQRQRQQQLLGQGKMKLGRDMGFSGGDYQRMTQLMQTVQMSLSASLESHTQSTRELGDTFVNTAAELGKKVDSLGEVLLIKNLPENERKMLIEAQLNTRLRALEAQEQEERKRKLQTEIENLELENRKRMLLQAFPTV